MPIRKELGSMIDLERARASFLSDQISTEEMMSAQLDARN
jgi:hypothetical protein